MAEAKEQNDFLRRSPTDAEHLENARELLALWKNGPLTADTVDFGDARLFFDDLAEELGHPYYPEVCLGLHGTQPVLLARSDTLGDYSLMEPPTVYSDEDDGTNENTTETAKQILDLVQRYLALQPHESANLSIALYNCNSARLPEATVNMLGNLYEDDEEVRCQVILRHHNAERLHQLYEKILEGSENDVDSFVASEASRDFMARLRIGIMADSAPIPSAQDGPPIDIVFLQDVIARLADPVWLTEPNDARVPEMLHHVPPRCSRRRPGTIDDLRLGHVSDFAGAAGRRLALPSSPLQRYAVRGNRPRTPSRSRPADQLPEQSHAPYDLRRGPPPWTVGRELRRSAHAPPTAQPGRANHPIPAASPRRTEHDDLVPGSPEPPGSARPTPSLQPEPRP